MRCVLLAILLALSACQPGSRGNSVAAALAMREPELLVELRAMVRQDQAVRELSIAHPDDKPLWVAIAAIDHANTMRMKEIIARHGWPGVRLVGDEGAQAAWLLVQHADADPEFQKLCLARLAIAAAMGDARAVDVAYLEDRVAVADGRPQRFGTQFGANGGPEPIEDEHHVDDRRAAVGLGTLAEYREDMKRVYGTP